MLTKLTTVTYSCFLNAKKTICGEADIAFATPNIDSTLSTGATSNHPSPKIIKTISLGKRYNTKPIGITIADIPRLTFINDFLRRLASLEIFTYIGNVTLPKTWVTSVIGNVDILYAIW